MVVEGKSFFVLGNSTEITSTICLKLKTWKDDIKNTAKYAIRFYSEYRVFVVWNLERRRDYGGTLDLTISKRLDQFDDELNQDTVYAHYCTFKGKNKENVNDKVMIIGISNVADFVENCDYWMAFNPEDDDCPKGIQRKELLSWPSEKKRKEYSVKQKQRDANFRRIVLDAYGNKCAICGCNIPEVLQAAHERGYEAAKTEWDDPNHGVCLCANHHLMYDAELIDIDLKEGTVCVHAPKVPLLPWQNVFQGKYKTILVKRG